MLTATTTVESPGLQDAEDDEDVDEMECDADSSSESFGGGVNWERRNLS